MADDPRLQYRVAAEEAVLKIIDAMPPIHQLIAYRTLYARGLRIDTSEREIQKEITKHLAAH